MEKSKISYQVSQDSLKDLVESLIFFLNEKTAEYNISPNVIDKVDSEIREVVQSNLKIRVIPASIRCHKIRQPVGSAKKPKSKYNWFEYNDQYEYTVDFMLEKGMPMRAKGSQYIAWSYNNGECEPITDNDKATIIFSGYKLYS
jgi:hypothetical protein